MLIRIYIQGYGTDCKLRIQKNYIIQLLESTRSQEISD